MHRHPCPCQERYVDAVEREYEQAILRACQTGDNDLAFDLSNGLTEYRTYFKDTE